MDYLQFLRARDKELSAERQRIEARGLEQERLAAEYHQAWNQVYDECQHFDHDADLFPSLAPFRHLYNILESRGFAVWLPDMRETITRVVDDRFQYRPGQIYFLELLITAGDPAASESDFRLKALSFNPSHPIPDWRQRGAMEVCEYIAKRREAAADAQERRRVQEANEAQEQRAAALKAAAEKRPALHKQLFAVYWDSKRLGPAAIRNKWNELYPRDLISDGEAGRDDI